MVLADFSTSGQAEVIASRVTLMNTVERYFELELEETICGIPYITLQGTPDDWRKIAAKVQQLRNYDMGWWADELEPIINEFVKASQGNPDREFWKCIVKKVRPGEVRGVGCLDFGGQTMFDGWFLKLMPFTENGRTPAEVDLTARMLGEICGTDFTYRLLDTDGSFIIRSIYVAHGSEAANEELRKAVEKLSLWKPATINGIPVPYYSPYKITID